MRQKAEGYAYLDPFMWIIFYIIEDFTEPVVLVVFLVPTASHHIGEWIDSKYFRSLGNNAVTEDRPKKSLTN